MLLLPPLLHVNKFTEEVFVKWLKEKPTRVSGMGCGFYKHHLLEWWMLRFSSILAHWEEKGCWKEGLGVLPIKAWRIRKLKSEARYHPTGP